MNTPNSNLQIQLEVEASQRQRRIAPILVTINESLMNQREELKQTLEALYFMEDAVDLKGDNKPRDPHINKLFKEWGECRRHMGRAATREQLVKGIERGDYDAYILDFLYMLAMDRLRKL